MSQLPHRIPPTVIGRDQWTAQRRTHRERAIRGGELMPMEDEPSGTLGWIAGALAAGFIAAFFAVASGWHF